MDNLNIKTPTNTYTKDRTQTRTLTEPKSVFYAYFQNKILCGCIKTMKSLKELKERRSFFVEIINRAFNDLLETNKVKVTDLGAIELISQSNWIQDSSQSTGTGYVPKWSMKMSEIGIKQFHKDSASYVHSTGATYSLPDTKENRQKSRELVIKINSLLSEFSKECILEETKSTTEKESFISFSFASGVIKEEDFLK